MSSQVVVAMTDDRDPMAPFVFHETEAYVGEGPLLRTTRRRLITVGALLVIVLAAIAALQVPKWLWQRSLDDTVNARTGLSDGRYVMDPNASMHDGADCWFRGPVRGRPDAGEITISGTGAVECAGPTDYVGRVQFTVTDGTAEIERAAGY